MKNFLSLFCAALWLCVAGVYGKGTVSGDLHWVGIPPSSDRPVSWGIPFSKGELKAGGSVCLRGADGTAIPSDCWPLAYWPDGSVKWAGMAAVVPAGVETVRFETVGRKAGAAARPATPLSVEETSGAYVLSTGKLRAYVPKQGGRLLDSLCL